MQGDHPITQNGSENWLLVAATFLCKEGDKDTKCEVSVWWRMNVLRFQLLLVKNSLLHFFVVIP